MDPNRATSCFLPTISLKVLYGELEVLPSKLKDVVIDYVSQVCMDNEGIIWIHLNHFHIEHYFPWNL